MEHEDGNGTPASEDNAGAGGEQGKQITTPTLLDLITDDGIKGNEALKGMDATTLAKGYIDLKSSLPVIPGSPDEYDFGDWPKDMPKDEEGYNTFRKLAHENKIPPDVWKKVVQFDIERSNALIARQEEADKAEIEKSITALKKEWGDKFDQNIDRARKVIEKLNLQDLVEKDVQLTNKPQFAKLLNWIADNISEDNLYINSSSNISNARVPIGEDGKPMMFFPSMLDKKTT